MGTVPADGARTVVYAEAWGNPRLASGSAFVELALVVVFMYVLLLGAVELTFLLLDYNRLQKNVRNAASFSSVSALNPAGTLLPVTSVAPGCQGQTLQQLVEDLLRCGECPCLPSANPAPVVDLAYCVDHDQLIYVAVDAQYSHPYSAAMSAVLGSAATLTARTLMRIPSYVVGNPSVPRCVR